MEFKDIAGLEIIGAETPPPDGSGYTVIVLGVSRGGTSATAGLLHHLGVYMGHSGEPPMFEDLFLNRAIREGDEEAFRKRLADYSRDHTLWGYKGVMLNQALSRYHHLFLRPRYLVVYRDVLAIASRARRSAGHDPQKIIARQLNEYQRITHFLNQENPTALQISYEKLMLDPQPIVRGIAQFVGVEPTRERLTAALGWLESDRSEYLEVSDRRLGVSSRAK